MNKKFSNINKRAVLSGLLLFSAALGLFFLGLFSFGCGEDNTVAELHILPTPATVGINRTLQFQAQGYTAAGNPVSVTPTWSCDPGIGSITATGFFSAASTETTGVVRAVISGLATTSAVSITAKGSVGGIVQSSNLTRLANITLSANGTVVVSGTRGTYTLANLPAGPITINSEQTINYLAASVTVTVLSGETVNKDITLSDRLLVSSESFSTVAGDTTAQVTITGIVFNAGGTTATSVGISYVFLDGTGQTIGVGTQTMGDLPPLTGRTFGIVTTIDDTTYATYNRTVSASGY